MAGRPLAFAALLALGACAPQVKPQPGIESQAPRDTGGTWLGGRAEAHAAGHPGENAFRPLYLGVEAMLARLALADKAERTLDAQYYIWKNDLSGRHLVQALLAAADRGVRVRLLLDDLGTKAKDGTLLALDAHPNIQIRLFNPSSTRELRGLSLVWNFSETNRRMHNKAFIADNQAAILGGRNIGDHYFGASTEVLFRDFDVLTFGPVVRDVSASFDQFWASPASVPIEAVAGRAAGPGDLALLRGELDAFIHEQKSSPYVTEVAEASRRMLEGGRLHWGRARLLVDDPAKVTRAPENTEGILLTQFGGLKDRIQREVLVVSPYFIPGEAGVAWFRELRSRGIQVTILTNSLASNDEYIVHSAYRRYREPLLEAGVRIYELRPDETKEGASAPKKGLGSSRASLHAKTFVFDRREIFVGSLNLDPRSARLNTEIGLLCDSPSLATVVAEEVERALDQVAWRLEREVDASGKARIVWIQPGPGGPLRLTEEPGTSTWRKLAVWFLGLLPIESQL